MKPAFFLFLSILTLSGCASDPAAVPSDDATPAPVSAMPETGGYMAEASPPPIHLAPDDPPRPALALAAVLIRREWSKASNRDVCAPLALTSDAGAPARARAADFSDGWAVAFDRPDQRSVYGIAGTGVIEPEGANTAQAKSGLEAQWPYFRSLTQLPQPAYAGYGREGAKAYTLDDPDGRGANSLAYVRVAGQRCLYNVWSRMGRAHLEALLDSLRPL